MSIVKFLLWGLLIWFLYNLVFRFIIPIYRTSKQMKNKFREMQERMQQQQANFQQQQRAAEQPPPKQQKPTGDYIDFEEVKA